MNNSLNKVPPHNLEAEETIIASLMINNKCFEDIEFLMPEDFYKTANQKIFKSMLALKKNKETVDLLTVASELNKTGELEAIGGAAYLSKISDQVPITINAEGHAKIITDLARARDIILIASGITEKGFNVSDIEEYISDSQAKILSVQTSTNKDRFHSVDSLMVEACDRIKKAQSAEYQIGLRLGFPKIDKFMQIWGSKLIVLAGRPGMGKTSLALSIAMRLGYQGDAVGILSIEMDKEQFADKMISATADVNSMGFYINGFLSDKRIDDIENAAGSLSDLPITINDAESNLDDIKRRCRKFKKMGKKIIMIDQLSQIQYEKGLKPYHGITKNCTAIKQLTKELNTPILLLTQLNRELEKRPNKRPMMSDLAETGKIEQDADIILFLYRPGVYEKETDNSVTEIICEKNRQGEKGTENQVIFMKKRGMFQMGV